jgi:hypothetical protein
MTELVPEEIANGVGFVGTAYGEIGGGGGGQLLCCLPVLLWKFIKEHMYTDIDDYYRRNLPQANQPNSSSLNPVLSEAPGPSAVASPLPAEAPPEAADRNKEPSILQHMRSRSDFTPGPCQVEGRLAPPPRS